MTSSTGSLADRERPAGHAGDAARLPLGARIAAGLLAAVVCGLAAPSAWATLGQPAESIAADQQFLRGETRSIGTANMRVDEITAADGNTVREYVSPAGLVFAVAWSGPQVPDLTRLLGAYFGEFQSVARSAVRRHGPIQLRSAHLVVESGGHVRALRGRAYLPHLLPESIALESVR